MAIFYTQREIDSSDRLGNNYPFKNAQNVKITQQSTTPPSKKKEEEEW